VFKPTKATAGMATKNDKRFHNFQPPPKRRGELLRSSDDVIFDTNRWSSVFGGSWRLCEVWKRGWPDTGQNNISFNLVPRQYKPQLLNFPPGKLKIHFTIMQSIFVFIYRGLQR
jgi:hypothetical protein